MKYSFFFLITILALNATAQEVSLIHTSDAFWEYSFGDIILYEGKSRIFPVKDTVIDSKQYTVFKKEEYISSYYSTDTSKTISKFYIRISEGKLFRKESNMPDSLIFDSSWQIDDTINVDIWNKQFILSSIDSILLGGIDRKRWTFDIFYNGYEMEDQGVFIQGIGGLYCSLDVLPIGGRMVSTDEYEISMLDCFTLNGEWITGDNCELGTEVQLNKKEPNILIYVDQKNTMLQFQPDFTFASSAVIKIYDLHGRIVFTSQVPASTTRVSYPANLHGIYLVAIQDEAIDYHQKILIR